MCVFSYPHLYRRHFAAPLTPASLFVLQILSHFLPLWWACSLHCGHTYAHFCSHTEAKSHMQTLSYTHCGRSARTLPDLCTYRRLPPSCSRHFCMGRHMCSISHTRWYVFFEWMRLRKQVHSLHATWFVFYVRRKITIVMCLCGLQGETRDVHWPLSAWEQRLLNRECWVQLFGSFFTHCEDRKRGISHYETLIPC